MKVENLFKRYLKTAGIFASNKSKKAINFMKEQLNRSCMNLWAAFLSRCAGIMF